MSSQVDLRQLAVRREAASPPRGRAWLTRFVLPGAILLGFLAVAGWALRDSLQPARRVMVVPVLTVRADVQAENTPLFQAAGWVEPRPSPALVTALTEGVVAEVRVVEGQEVAANQVVATMIDADAQLALKAALADRNLRQAEVEGAAAALAAAQANFDRPTQLQTALAEAEALLAQKKTEQAVLPEQLKGAEARELSVRRDLEGKQQLGGTVAPVVVEKALADLRAASATVAELKTRSATLGTEIDALTRKRDLLKTRLELRVDEARQLAEAKAQAQAAAARLKQAEAALDAAQLRLKRMEIKAPTAGRVLSLLARPGARLTPDNGTVATLYDPTRLQVRVDVRLDDVPRVQPGMRVRIETPAAPSGPLSGQVLYPTALADIQKNTLQVKVSIDSPPDTIRPDMLVQVTFLAPPAPKSTEGETPLRLLVPRSLVEMTESGGRLWIADRASGVARLRTVELGGTAGEFVEVLSGLNPTDKLITTGRDSLHDGTRIQINEENSP